MGKLRIKKDVAVSYKFEAGAVIDEARIINSADVKYSLLKCGDAEEYQEPKKEGKAKKEVKK